MLLLILVLLVFLLVLNILILPLVYYLTFLDMLFLVLLSLLSYRILDSYKIFHCHFYGFFLLFHYVLASLVLSCNALFLTSSIMYPLGALSLFLLDCS